MESVRDEIWFCQAREVLGRRDASPVVTAIAESLLERYATLAPVSAAAAALRDVRRIEAFAGDSRIGAQLAPTDAEKNAWRRPADHNFRTTKKDLRDAIRDVMEELFPKLPKGGSKKSREWRLYRLRVDVMKHGPSDAMLVDGRFSAEEIATVWGAYVDTRRAVLKEIERVHTAGGVYARKGRTFRSRMAIAKPVVAKTGDAVTLQMNGRTYNLAEYLANFLASYEPAPVVLPDVTDPAPEGKWNFPERTPDAGDPASPVLLRSARELDLWMARKSRPSLRHWDVHELPGPQEDGDDNEPLSAEYLAWEKQYTENAASELLAALDLMEGTDNA